MTFRKSRVASAAFLTRFSYIYSGETTLESGTVEINLAILGIDLFVYYVYI
jgi:hypothetical protein